MQAGLSRRLAATFARALQLFEDDTHGGCQERDYQSEELIAMQKRMDELYLPFAQWIWDPQTSCLRFLYNS